MKSAAEHILETQDNLDELQHRLDAVEQEKEQPIMENLEKGPLPTFEEAQKIIDRLVYNHNEGIEESDDEVAEELGVSPRVVEHVRKSAPGLRPDSESDLPQVDRMGLSPRAFKDLLSSPVPVAEGALVLRSPESLRSLGGDLESSISETPIIRFANWLLNVVGKDGTIPATKAGYVKPFIVTKAWKNGVISSPLERAERTFGVPLDEHDKRFERTIEILRPKREADSKEFLQNRELIEAASLIRLRGNSFVVTDKGRRLRQDPVGLYHELIVTTFKSYEWYETGYFDGIPGMHERAGFLFYAAHLICDGEKYGEAREYTWAPVHRLTEALIGTMPDLAEAVASHADDEVFGFGEFLHIILEETFVRFFGGQFGLLEYRETTARKEEALPPGPDTEPIARGCNT